MLVHIQVGDAVFTPNSNDLTEAVDRFLKGGVVINPSHTHVTVANCAISEIRERNYTVIVKAGNRYWTPSQEDLDSYKAQFEAALKDPEGAVVATRDSVYVEILLHGDLNSPPAKIYFI